LNIGFVSYGFASAAYLLLGILVLTAWRGHLLGMLMLLTSFFTAIWAALFSTYRGGFAIPPVAILHMAEVARDAGWCLFLMVALGQGPKDAGNSLYRRSAIILFVIVFGSAFLVIAALPAISRFTTLPDFLGINAVLIALVGMSITGLMFVEQLFRNTRIDDRWKVQYLCLGIGGIFAYDLFLYSDALLFKHLNVNLLDARGMVNALMVPLIAVSIARNPNWSLNIHVSRDVVFHSATLTGAGLYLLSMAGLGYYIRYLGGAWGVVLQIVFLCGAGILLLTLLFSARIRAHVRVFLSKHFFSFKYDYREEWLRFTGTFAEAAEDVPQRVIFAISRIVDSPGGVLWIKRDDGLYERAARWNMCYSVLDREFAADSMEAFLEKEKSLIDLDDYQSRPDTYTDLQLPSWFQSIPDAWLLIPLLFNEAVYAILLLARSPVRHTINWEDRDLLKTAGRQAASYLAQFQTAQALMQARQFEAFNRLSAYVIHDLKNIIAQQSLIIANAEKHKSNPAFIDDMLGTIENAVRRMRRLMEQLRSGIRGDEPQTTDLAQLFAEVIGRRSSQQPQPAPDKLESGLTVRADRDRLANVFSHIVQNAQEATDKSGRVVVRVFRDVNRAVVEVEDDGCGMDANFIEGRLFRPFDSTKGLTGMGIGAFESREFIRALGGEVQVESSPGEGTLFRILLPCQEWKEPIPD
jgi:putative PEP-CTERM system histidine kinase